MESRLSFFVRSPLHKTPCSRRAPSSLLAENQSAAPVRVALPHKEPLRTSVQNPVDGDGIAKTPTLFFLFPNQFLAIPQSLVLLSPSSRAVSLSTLENYECWWLRIGQTDIGRSIPAS